MAHAIDRVAGWQAGRDAAARVTPATGRVMAALVERAVSEADRAALRRADEKRQRRAARRLEASGMDHEHTDDERVRFTDLEVAPDGMGHALPPYDPDNPGPHTAPGTGEPPVQVGPTHEPDGGEHELERQVPEGRHPDWGSEESS